MCRLSDECGKDGGNTEVAGGHTLVGQMASFMESLKLSYREVFEVIPYEQLLLMQRDKLHIVYGDRIEYVSARDRMKSKMKCNGRIDG